MAQLQASIRSMDESEEERNGEVEAEIGNSESVAATTSQREENEIVEAISRLIERAAQLGDYRKECYCLVRHMKLLLPLLEEIRELDRPVSGNGVSFLSNLRDIFLSAMELLRVCNEGSKINLAVESEAIMVKFGQINENLYQALDSVPFDEFGISTRTKLLRKQLKRSEGRTETNTQGMGLKTDMMVVLSKEDNPNADSAIIKRLAEKLELKN